MVVMWSSVSMPEMVQETVRRLKALPSGAIAFGLMLTAAEQLSALLDEVTDREARAREEERTLAVEAVKRALVDNPDYDGARHLAIDAIRARRIT